MRILLAHKVRAVRLFGLNSDSNVLVEDLLEENDTPTAETDVQGTKEGHRRMNTPTAYEHIAYVREEDGQTYLCIDRLFEDGRREFRTQIAVEAASSADEAFGFLDKAADWLGQAICSDNPAFRSTVFGEVWPGETDT